MAAAERDAEGVLNVGLTIPVCNLLAYLLGPIALTQPHWVAVGLTATAVLLLTGRERLHTMARQLELPEIVTAGKFLILTGIILPLLPNEPITPLTRVTPYQAWLALVAVCTLSYGSYLLQRYWTSNRSAFVTAILGGLYSSAATTVVLARRASTGEIPLARVQVGIALATAVMYLRILAMIAVFNWSLAASLTPSLLALLVLFILASILRRGCEPGVTCAGRVFRFCKQPLEVGENIRDERGPPRVFGGGRLRKQDQKITGLGHGFNPVGGRCGEKIPAGRS